MKGRILLSDIDLGKEEISAVVGVLKSKWLTMGEKCEEFERKFADYLNVKYAFVVSSGTGALHIACRALGIGNGDDVVCPSLTFVATANSILYTGARPVFADIIGPDNFNISPSSILEKISPKTKAIMVVHFAGYPCGMDEIMKIARENKLFVIEDAAHAPGATYKGKKCGTIGDIGCFSFYANKNLATGEGGMVVTNGDDLAKKIKALRSHAMTTLTLDRVRGHAYTYDVVDLGYNYRSDELKSAIGIVQLSKLESNNKKRKLLVNEYIRRLTNISEISIPFRKFEGDPSYHIFPILLKNRMHRKLFMEGLKNEGVQTSVHYSPIHLFSYYRKRFGYREGLLPKTEFVAEHEVTLPLYPLMKKEDVETICKIIRKMFRKNH
jgi:dTDP-4-amino-4,6-dideoxygalactose transaminase